MIANPHLSPASTYPAQIFDASQAIAVWNGSLGRFSWLSSRGREVLQKPLNELTGTLLPTSLRTLNRIAATSQTSEIRPAVLRFKDGYKVTCLVERLLLSGGNYGVVLYPGKSHQSLDFDSRKPCTLSGVSDAGLLAGKRHETNGERDFLPFTAPQLTVEEWKSFKSIGRKVRRLCKEKQANGPFLGEQPVQVRDRRKIEISHTADLLPVFDAFLILDIQWRVIKSSGALNNTGRKAGSIHGQTPLQLFSIRESASVAKSMRGVEMTGKSIKKTVLLASNDVSGATGCKALFGNWAQNPTRYFIGLIFTGPLISQASSANCHEWATALCDLAA